MNDLFSQLQPIRSGDRTYDKCRIRECVVYELREKHKLKYRVIAELLQRHHSTIIKIYNNYKFNNSLYPEIYLPFQNAKCKYINVITNVSTQK